MSKKCLTLNEVRSLVKYWKDKLRLNEWRLVVRVVERNVMPEEGTLTSDNSTKQGTVRIVEDTPDEMENTIIHELLHIHINYLTQHPDSHLRYEMMEYLIHSVAEALCDLKNNTNINKEKEKWVI